MDLNMGLNYDPNILDNKIAPTVTVKKFNNKFNKDKEEVIKREDNLNESELLDMYNFILLIDNEVNITYKVDPENL